MLAAFGLSSAVVDTSDMHDTSFDPECLSLIDTYSGTENLQAWLAQLQTVAELYKWTETVCMKVAVLRLTGAARSWAHQHRFARWSHFCKQLDLRFGETAESAIACLEQCFQHHDESPRDFADRFMCSAVKAGRREDPALLFCFTQRLLPELREEALRQRLHSMAEVVAFCDHWLNMHDRFDAWQQPDSDEYGCASHTPDNQSWDALDDSTPPAYGQPHEHALQLFQECSDVDEGTCLLASISDSLEFLLHRPDCLDAHDPEFFTLQTLIEQTLAVFDSPCCESVHAWEAADDDFDACDSDSGLELLACMRTANAPPAHSEVTVLVDQQFTPSHSDAFEHLTHDFGSVSSCVPASPLVTAPHSLGALLATVPGPSCSNCSSPLPWSPRPLYHSMHYVRCQWTHHHMNFLRTLCLTSLRPARMTHPGPGPLTSRLLTLTFCQCTSCSA